MLPASIIDGEILLTFIIIIILTTVLKLLKPFLLH